MRLNDERPDTGVLDRATTSDVMTVADVKAAFDALPDRERAVLLEMGERTSARLTERDRIHDAACRDLAALGIDRAHYRYQGAQGYILSLRRKERRRIDATIKR